MVDTLHNLADPGGIALNHLRGRRHIASVRIQIVHGIHAVISMSQVLHVFKTMLNSTITQRTAALGVLQNLLQIVVRNHILLVLVITVKNIMLHRIILLRFFLSVVFALRPGDKVINDLLLFVGQGVKDIFYSFCIFCLLILLYFFCHGFLFLLHIFVGML